MNPRHALIAIGVALATPLAAADQARAWVVVPRQALQVTAGSITRTFASPPLDVGTNLQTRTAITRATERDRGLHARHARLRFRFNGDSLTTVPSGSGVILRQIGLKLRSNDPCNLLYVTWRNQPNSAIVVSVKRNPGQTTSAQCGNRGYKSLATIAVPPDPPGSQPVHELRVTMFPLRSSLVLRVFRDGPQVYAKTLGPSVVGMLDGPVGIRSDNGDYTFQLAVQARHREM
jgi:hypothetical protein